MEKFIAKQFPEFSQIKTAHWVELFDYVMSIYSEPLPYLSRVESPAKFLTKHALPVELADVAGEYMEALRKLYSGEWKTLGFLKQFTTDHSLFDTEFLYNLVLQLPHVSEEDSTKVAYYQTMDKMSKDLCTRIKPAAYAGRRLFNVGGESKLSDTQLDDFRETFLAQSNFKLNLIANDDVQGWGDVYRSSYIKSCMNNSNYNITLLDTYKCYATSAFGLPDNGLRLAWLPHPDHSDDPAQAVARAIVHEPSKTYVSVYGSDTYAGKTLLNNLLVLGGYSESDGFPEDTLLYTFLEYSPVEPDCDDDASLELGWALPYVDGDTRWGSYGVVNGVSCVQLNSYESCPSKAQNIQDTSALFDFNTGDEVYSQTCPITGRAMGVDTYQVYYAGCVVEACEYAHDQCKSQDALYYGDSFAVYHGYDFVTAVDSAGCYQDFVSTEDNLDYHGVRWSESRREYIFGYDVVFSEEVGDYMFEHEVVQVEYKNRSVLAPVVCCTNIEGHWVLDCDVECIDGVDVPEEGLSDELDELRENLLNRGAESNA